MMVDGDTVKGLEQRAALDRAPGDALELLRALDPDFAVPGSSHELKVAKARLKQKVAAHIERLFLEKLLADNAGSMSATARAAEINRTFLYRLLKRHKLLPAGIAG